MKIAVVGSISAGVSLARKLAAGKPGTQISVYEKSAFYSCGACGLPYYLTVSMEELQEAVDGKERELNAQHIEAHPLSEVTSVNPEAHTITVRDLQTGSSCEQRYDRLVIATGCGAAIPAVPGAGRLGVQSLRGVEDLLFLKEMTKTPYVHDIAVLGGGYEAIETAKAFQKMGRSVRVICEQREILTDYDPEVSAMIRAQLQKQGIEFSLGQRVTGFEGRSYIEKVKTTSGSYDCDLCIAASGAAANTAFLAGTGIRLGRRGEILVDDELKSNLPDIYAAGDCTSAAGEGLHSCSLHAAGIEIARAGLTQTQARQRSIRVKTATASSCDRPGICPNPNEITLKLVYDATSRKVLGAQGWGVKNVASRINAIAVAIKGQMTVEQLAEVELVFSSQCYSIWDPIQVVCSEAR